jgi:hypothetical protein
VPIFVPLVDQQVDIFTKSLLDPTFTNLMACISIGAFPLKGPLEVIFGVKVAYGVHVRIFRHLGVSKIYLVYCVIR